MLLRFGCTQIVTEIRMITREIDPCKALAYEAISHLLLVETIHQR